MWNFYFCIQFSLSFFIELLWNLLKLSLHDFSSFFQAEFGASPTLWRERRGRDPTSLRPNVSQSSQIHSKKHFFNATVCIVLVMFWLKTLRDRGILPCVYSRFAWEGGSFVLVPVFLYSPVFFVNNEGSPVSKNLRYIQGKPLHLASPHAVKIPCGFQILH
jgi:hypothetical protein